jgi:hypothetical protein
VLQLRFSSFDFVLDFSGEWLAKGETIGWGAALTLELSLLLVCSFLSAAGAAPHPCR